MTLDMLKSVIDVFHWGKVKWNDNHTTVVFSHPYYFERTFDDKMIFGEEYRMAFFCIDIYNN